MHALLPLFMVGTLGASVLVVGIIEGVAESIALIVKVFSGYWSDVTRHRKPLVVLGYGLAAVSKLAFPLAPTLSWVVAARFADRVGKGIRGAPRDALIADLTQPAVRVHRVELVLERPREPPVLTPRLAAVLLRILRKAAMSTTDNRAKGR